MKIVMDMDGVLADFIRGYTTLGHKLLGEHIPIHGHDDHKVWSYVEGMTDAEERAVWAYIKASTGFWRDLHALASDDEMVKLGLLNRLHEVYFCTSRPGRQAKQQTEQWLIDRGITRPAVIVTGKKGEFCKAVGADYAIDDKAGNAVYTSYESPITKSYVIDRPYNQFSHDVIGGSVYRVKTLEEFFGDIEAAA